MTLSFFAVSAALTQANLAPEVTIYNGGFALVKEVRRLDLTAGRQIVAVEDVAQFIEPTSVGVRSLTAPKNFSVLEQNYQYDLISPIAILNKAVGTTIRFVRLLGNGTKDILEGTLLSAPTAIVGSPDGSSQTYNGMVIRTADGRIILNPTGEVEVMTLPEGLISKPTLLWDLVTDTGGTQDIELSYITQQISWEASYVLTLGKADTGDVRGWVSLNNRSGATYKDAKLKLLAGEVQRARNAMARMGRGGGGVMEDSAASKGFQEESLFEYHLYTLQRPATVKNNELKQLSLLEGTGVKVEKKLIVDSLRDFGQYYPGEGAIGSGIMKPMVKVEFVNSKANGMGMPLPQGAFKVYQRDASGSVQLLGEDRIEHTPKDERVSLFVGRSFDVVAERKRLSWKWLDNSRRNIEEKFEIEVRNRKEVAETVNVIERHYWDYEITAKSDPFTKLEASTLQFTVTLKPNEVKKITYTVVTKW